MKIVILCGGKGTRIRGVSEVIPKPMLPIGEKPILWHIMKSYAHYGMKDFVLCLGYKGWVIKEFFLNYFAKMADVTINLSDHNSAIYHNSSGEDWEVTLAETGEETMTGGRISQVCQYLSGNNFGVTYGDGLSDVNLKEVLVAHKKAGALGTILGVYPPSRFGEIKVGGGNIVSEFAEKPVIGKKLINGGFMFFKRKALAYFSDDEGLVLEKGVLPKMARDKQLSLHHHRGFWQCIDTPREFELMNELWKGGKAPWKAWG